MPVDARFVVWCAACGWNADPHPPELPRGRLEALRVRLAARYGEQLHAELAAHADRGVEAPSLDASGVAAYVLAWCVHLVSAALAVAGGVLVAGGLSSPDSCSASRR